MFTYVKRTVPGTYVELPAKLDAESYSDLGETYDDYLRGYWVLLTDKQVAFHEEHPYASVKEVFNMEIEEPVVYERTIEDAKREKESQIRAYDTSDAVNSFTINGAMSAWFTPAERQNYKQSVDSAKLLGVPTLSFYVKDIELTIETAKAEQLLAALQLYADAAYIVTKKHQLAVQQLETIEEVDEYDYTVGYPEKLNFELI